MFRLAGNIMPGTEIEFDPFYDQIMSALGGLGKRVKPKENFVLICVLMSRLFWTSFLAMYLAMNLQTLNFFWCLARQKGVVPFYYFLLKLVFLMN